MYKYTQQDIDILNNYFRTTVAQNYEATILDSFAEFEEMDFVNELKDFVSTFTIVTNSTRISKKFDTDLDNYDLDTPFLKYFGSMTDRDRRIKYTQFMIISPVKEEDLDFSSRKYNSTIRLYTIEYVKSQIEKEAGKILYQLANVYDSIIDEFQQFVKEHKKELDKLKKVKNEPYYDDEGRLHFPEYKYKNFFPKQFDILCISDEFPLEKALALKKGPFLKPLFIDATAYTEFFEGAPHFTIYYEYIEDSIEKNPEAYIQAHLLDAIKSNHQLAINFAPQNFELHLLPGKGMIHAKDYPLLCNEITPLSMEYGKRMLKSLGFLNRNAELEHKPTTEEKKEPTIIDDIKEGIEEDVSEN